MVHVHPCPSTWTLYLGPIRMGVFLLLGLNQSGGWPAWDGECNQQKWFPKTNTIMEEREREIYIYILLLYNIYIYIYMNVVNLMHILTSRTLSKSKSITLGLSRLVHAVNPSLCFKDLRLCLPQVELVQGKLILKPAWLMVKICCDVYDISICPRLFPIP